MIDNRANLNLFAVSANARETGINTPQTLDTSLLVPADFYLNIDPRREDNSNEANGREEADIIYDNGNTASGTCNFEKLKPHEAAFMLAYGLGSVTTTAAGSGYLHTITPIAGGVDINRDNPSFTGAQRVGKTINKRRFSSCFVDSCSITFAQDDWVKGSMSIKATGLYADTVEEETVTALDNVTSLTLSKAVAGSTAAERLANVQIVRAISGGGMKFATVSAVSSANPAVLTISSLGGSGTSTTYRVLYTPTEPTWATFPSRVVETSMRVSQACLYLGGAWNGSAFVGGKAIGADIESCAYEMQNNSNVKFTMCAGGAYAGKHSRDGRMQTIKLSREMRDMLLQTYMANNEYFGMHILCEGADFDTGHAYTLELIFPRLGLLGASLSTNNKKVAEAGDLKVLEDETYGPIIVRVKNLVSAYAA